MPLVELLAHPAGRLLTLALLHFLWQGFTVAGLLVLVADLGGMRRATARYTCSLLALVAVTACPLITLVCRGARQDATLAVSHLPFSLNEPSQPLGALAPLLAQIQALQPLALAAWLAGVAVFGGRLLVGAIGLAHLRRGRLPLPRSIMRIVHRLGQRMQIDARPLVFLSRQVAEAMAVGVIRPLVLIPASWATEMPLEMLEAVIAHELAHLRRRDLWVNLMQRIVETMLFYHPAVWWLSRRLRIERELCADELAVAATGRRLEYAQALEQVAHRRQAEVRPALAAFLRGEQNMRLLERVRNVLGLAAGERSRLWPAGLVALALPLGLWLASLSVSVALADDDDDKPATRRERSEKEVERRVEAKFFGKSNDDKQDAAPKDGERRKEGPRDGNQPRKEGAHDGDQPKKEGARDGDFRREGNGGPKDGEVRKRALKDGENSKEEIVERKIVRKEGDRPAGEGARIEELTAIVKRLSAQVERLQDEVSALRSDKGEGGSPKPKTRLPVKEKTSADEPKPEVRRLKEKPSSDEPSENEARARKERQAAERKTKENTAVDGASNEEAARRKVEAAERKRIIGDAEEATLKKAIEMKRAAAKAEYTEALDRKKAAEKIEAEKREIEKRERQ